MSTLTAIVDDGLVLTSPDQETGYGQLVAQGLQVEDVHGKTTYGVQPHENIGLDEPYLAYEYVAAGLVQEVIRLHDHLAVGSVFAPEVREALRIVDSLLRHVPLELVDSIGISMTQVIARAIVVLDRLRVLDQFNANSITRLSLVDVAFFSSQVLNFFGLGVVDGLQIQALLAEQAVFSKSLLAGLGLHDVLGVSLFVQLTISDDIELDDANVVNMIYQGDTLLDSLAITVGFVDPGGGFTTWAINTRTGAVTEYQNYVFNSFGQMGQNFLGATSDGLWLLNDAQDNGKNVVADIRGAMLSLGGSKFTQLDGVYLGMRVRDNAKDFILKIIIPGAGLNGVDKVYVYQFNPQNMKTTKINIGKGLRTRYLQWELVTPGPEFDLDSIEFVPVVSRRRV